jgi:hypothetical protein
MGFLGMVEPDYDSRESLPFRFMRQTKGALGGPLRVTAQVHAIIEAAKRLFLSNLPEHVSPDGFEKVGIFGNESRRFSEDLFALLKVNGAL